MKKKGHEFKLTNYSVYQRALGSIVTMGRVQVDARHGHTLTELHYVFRIETGGKKIERHTDRGRDKDE